MSAMVRGQPGRIGHRSVGREIAPTLTRFALAGATRGAVSFPRVELPSYQGAHPILNVHRSVPGVLRATNRIVSDANANIDSQVLSTDENLGYLIMDRDQNVSAGGSRAVAALPTNIRTRCSADPGGTMRPIRLAVTSLSLLLVVTHAREDTSAASSSFGLYLLALSWAPNFCCGHEGRGQCDGLATSFGADHLTLHGLWPSYTDAESARGGADYPVYCGRYGACKSKNAPAPSFCDPDPATIPAAMSKYGPGYVTDNNFLANHDWPKHGSCSGLDPSAFFAAMIKSLLALPGESGTPDLLRRSPGAEVATADLRASFGAPASVVLSCDAGCNLVEVGICLAHDPRGNPTGPIPCPANVTGREYDNGCVTRGCAKIRVQKAGQCGGGATGTGTGTGTGTARR